ncbi:UPF0158 family protein [Lentibacillus sp. L22]|uniref:UPF0158 family protein n=1 Tax=Lentibacillus TaxID=175304 RepID=UPI0022B1A3F1|nr:UPF0158 family protein [Lentibacillus daqui]
MRLAYDIVEDADKYIELPTPHDIDEYDMVENFCFTVKIKKKKEILLKAIRGKGAFGRFRHHIADLDLEQDWYMFRDQSYKQIAIDFCEMNGLEYVE